MLARASSDAGVRLHRSKSTTSVRRPPPPLPEPLDPDVAQKHALAAATTAYARAHELDTTDGARSRDSTRASTLSQPKSNASRHSEGRHFPARESSLRFSQSQKGGYMSSLPRRSLASPEAKLPRILSGTPAEAPLAQPPRSVDENARPAPQSGLHRTFLAEPANTIRKARSMYCASSIQTGSPLPRPPAKYMTSPPPVSPVPEQCRSFLSDLGISTSASAVTPRLPAIISGDEDIDKVRDRYLQDFQKRQLRPRSSFILGPFKKRQEKERSRLSSFASGSVLYDNVQPIVMSSAEDVTPAVVPQKEKRSFSNSLKNKIKRVFRRASTVSTTLPVQQIDASRDYFSSCISPGPHVDGSFDHIPSPDHTTFDYIRTLDSSLAVPDGNVRPGSSASSVLSDFTASRATSWNSSTICHIPPTRDSKRLSVIHEAKGSVANEAGMTSRSPTRRPLRIPTLSGFRDSMQMDNVAEECSMAVDPQRVFSALMKEIGGTKGINEGKGDPEIEDLDNSISKRSNHSNSATLTNQTRMSDLSKHAKATIRSVSPEPVEGPEALARATSVRGAVRIPREDLSHSSIHGEHHPNEPLDNPHESPNRRNRLQRPLPHTITPTPDQIASRVEKSKSRWKTPLEDDGEQFPFFPKSTRRTYTVSTFARKNFTFKHSDEHPKSAMQADCREGATTVQTPINPRELLSPLSPSVYSQDSDGHSILMNDSAVSLAHSEPDPNGTAVIITSRPVKSYALGSPLPRPRAINASAKSSKDWKAWLSKEVSELELLPQEEITIQDRYTNSGHRREHADILDSPDFSLGGPGSPNHRHSAPARQRRPTIGDGPEGRSTQNRQILGERSSSQAGPRRSTLGEGSSSRASWHTPPSTERPPTRPMLEERPSSRMNERFPFIETGRKTSSQSSHPRTIPARRSPEAETISLRATPTPDPRMYTSYNPPPSNANARYEPPKRRANETTKGEEKGSGKENARQSVSAKSLCIPPRSMSRPQSLQPLRHSVFNRSHSSLAHYTTTAEEKNHRHSMPPITPPTPRVRPHVKSASITSRPKSAFDLRGQCNPNVFVFPGTVPDSSERSVHSVSNICRKPVTGRALEGETLKMILAGPYSNPSPFITPIPSPIANLRLKNGLNASPSRLSLKEEPSLTPGVMKDVDVTVEEKEKAASIKSVAVSIAVSCPGTPTAGQKMAERFLRERTVEPEHQIEEAQIEGMKINADHEAGRIGTNESQPTTAEPEEPYAEILEIEGDSEMTPVFL